MSWAIVGAGGAGAGAGVASGVASGADVAVSPAGVVLGCVLCAADSVAGASARPCCARGCGSVAAEWPCDCAKASSHFALAFQP